MKLPAFAKYAWFVMAFNIGVIIWGAYVRATGSGAGCGNHWPLCDGVVIPKPDRIETVIEFSHRISSGIALLLVLGMLILALRIYSKGSIVRRAAIFSMVFMITEALIGAGLVLFELVAQDTSTARAVSISIHLLNTFLLLACITLTAWWASGGKPVNIRRDKKSAWLLGVGFIGMLILGTSGALTALGDTLFPITSLAEGLRQDFSPTAHFLIRLRILHPTIAVLVSIYLIIIVGWILWRGNESVQKIFGRLLTFLVLVQLLAGLINVYLLAPVWLQLVHLFLADAIWISLVLFTAKTLSQENLAQDGITDPVKVISQSSGIS
jgi:heme A synthase